MLLEKLIKREDANEIVLNNASISGLHLCGDSEAILIEEDLEEFFKEHGIRIIYDNINEVLIEQNEVLYKVNTIMCKNGSSELSQHIDFRTIMSYQHIEEVSYISIWDGGLEIKTNARYDTQTKKVFDIEKAPKIISDIVEVFEKEIIEFPDGRKIPVMIDADGELRTEDYFMCYYDFHVFLSRKNGYSIFKKLEKKALEEYCPNYTEEDVLSYCVENDLIDSEEADSMDSIDEISWEEYYDMSMELKKINIK